MTFDINGSEVCFFVSSSKCPCLNIRKNAFFTKLRDGFKVGTMDACSIIDAEVVLGDK